MSQWSISSRPRTLGDLYGLQNIKNYFYEKAKSGEWPKAVLLKGQFGNGKSTTANILATMLVCQNPLPNGDPCCKCASCEAIISERFDRDVVRIDGGQSSKADVVEMINEHIATPPMFDKRKVIIIEEVQELSAAAKNSLLKVLEHPRDRIHFILLSMENAAVSGFTSRCVPFVFKKLQAKEILFFLKKAMEEHNLWEDPSIPDEFRMRGLATISQVAMGSLRQALQILELCITGRYFTAQEILDNVGFVDETTAISILIKLLEADDSVWRDLSKFDAYEFFAISYKILSDAAMYKVSGFIEDEGNQWVVDNTKRIAAYSAFEDLLTAFNILAPQSKPFLRKAEFVVHMTKIFSLIKAQKGVKKLVEEVSTVTNSAEGIPMRVRGKI